MRTKSHSMKLGARVFKIELRSFLDTCEAVDTPRALACYLLAKNGEWNQYLGLSFPDTLVSTFPDDLLVTEMMRKNPRIKTGIDTQAVAKRVWYQSEASCAFTNDILRSYCKGEFFFPADVQRVIANAQMIIQNMLGPLSRGKLSFAESKFRFGPGATTACSGSLVVPSRKMVCAMHITPRLYPYFKSLTTTMWRQGISNIEVRSSNKVVFVPKDAKTDRAIGIEPHMNIYVQLGIGALLRRQLSRAGLNLDTQADKNRERAGLAQVNGEVTIDLSSASDSISSELVWLLLPFDWAALLDLARVDYSTIDDDEVKLEKFSSMGNGFTFELESLIFWALAKACGSSSPAVFGDDIIVPKQDSELLIRTLEHLGFSVNKRKTFLYGVFYESCGTDWWNGINVRPLYLKGEYNDLTSARIRISNKIRRYSHRRCSYYACDARFYHAWRSCFSEDFRAVRTCISDTYGDDGLICNIDEANDIPIAPNSVEGHYGRVWRPRSIISQETDMFGAYLTALNWGSPNTTRSIEPVRGIQEKPRFKRLLISEWYVLGPWV